jgi:diaminopimelate decarboxylase
MDSKDQERRVSIGLRPWIGQNHGELRVEDIPLSRILEQQSTPFYVCSLSAFADRIRLYQDHLRRLFPQSRVYYALKANWGSPLVSAVQAAGEGFDIVSLGELRHLMLLGVPPSSVCFAGVGKTREEIIAALEASVGILNVEHLAELEMALEEMQRITTTTRIALRLNPCVEVDTHPHLKTGALDSKFGMLAEDLLGALSSPRWQEILGRKSAQGSLLCESICGVHVHVGSQLLKGTLLGGVVDAAAALAERLVGLGLPIDHLDCGGGLGVPHTGVPHDGSDIADHTAALHKAILRSVQSRPLLVERWGNDLARVQVCLEPGRSLVASSTVFVTRALYTRTNGGEHRFVYVDGGMNDFPRPSIYGARHDVCLGMPTGCAPGTRSFVGGEAVKGGEGLQIVGPVCESGDVLRRDPGVEEIASVSPGDVLVFFEAGAYCRSMASGYNLRGLPESLFVKGDQFIQETKAGDRCIPCN